MKYLIACLGNPGAEYDITRHNIGFMVADYYAAKKELVFKDKRYAFITESRLKNRLLYFIKPHTFMNLSGKAVRYWLKELAVPDENLLVITDDLALPLGKLRLRGKGGAGGHNGLKNIEDLLGTTEYPRLRFGISDEFSRGRQVDYVLSQFSEEELAVVNQKLPLTTEIIESFALQGLPRTMSIYNNN